MGTHPDGLDLAGILHLDEGFPDLCDPGGVCVDEDVGAVRGGRLEGVPRFEWDGPTASLEIIMMMRGRTSGSV